MSGKIDDLIPSAKELKNQAAIKEAEKADERLRWMAAADAENATAPIASAPKAAAARREFNFNASRLNIGRPPVWSPARHSARL